MRGLYRSLVHSPHTRFVAYRMPVDGQPAIDPSTYADWEHTDMRTFDFHAQPDWVNVSVRAGEYAWKGMIIEEVVRDYGGLVLWLDSGDRLKPSFGEHKWREVADLGIFSDQTGGAMAEYVLLMQSRTSGATLTYPAGFTPPSRRTWTRRTSR